MGGTRLKPAGQGKTIEDEGSALPDQPALNFIGAGVTAADGSGKTDVTIPGGAGSGHVIEDEGTPLATQPDLNFIGAGVTAANDIPNTATTVTIPGPPAQAQASVGHFESQWMLGEKFINETWFYRSVAHILEYWESSFGTITRGSDNFINVTSAAGTTSIAEISTNGAWDVRVSPVGAYVEENIMVFRCECIMVDFGTADYFFGCSSTITNGETTAAVWYEELNSAIGFITTGTALQGYIQDTAGPGNNETIDLSTVISGGNHDYEWRVNSGGFIEFFYDGVLVGTSTNSPDSRPTGQMSPRVAVRGATDVVRCYGISMSCRFRGF